MAPLALLVIVFMLLAGGNGVGDPATPATAPAPDYILRDCAWTYKDTAWTAHLAIPGACYEFYKSRPHDRLDNYAQYALSDYDRDYLKGLICNFRDAGAAKNYSETDDVLNILAFVQSMPYAPDKLSTGYDEYPRYPIEPLVDGGGDCEDTAILAAAILNEMGYGTVLIRLDGHMALGVKCTGDFPGAYYVYKGARYYYLDTTCKGLGIGQEPAEYARSNATILPMASEPCMYANFSFRVEDRGADFARCRVHCNVSNVGTGTAKNATLRIMGHGGAPGAYVPIGDVDEGAAGWVEATLAMPVNETTQIECALYGENFKPVEVKSGLFYL